MAAFSLRGHRLESTNEATCAVVLTQGIDLHECPLSLRPGVVNWCTKGCRYLISLSQGLGWRRTRRSYARGKGRVFHGPSEIGLFVCEPSCFIRTSTTASPLQGLLILRPSHRFLGRAMAPWYSPCRETIKQCHIGNAPYIGRLPGYEAPKPKPF